MLASTNRTLSSLFNDTKQQKINAVADEEFMMGINQSRTVGAYIDTFELDSNNIKSIDIRESGLKLVSPLRG